MRRRGLSVVFFVASLGAGALATGGAKGKPRAAHQDPKPSPSTAIGPGASAAPVQVAPPHSSPSSSSAPVQVAPPHSSPSSSLAPPPAPASPSSASSAQAGSVSGCVETVPAGAQRPSLTESFPARGYSGYAATLVVTVDHGKGESVLARGLELQNESEAAKALKDAGFVLPDQSGSGAARLTRHAADAKHPEHVTTTLEVPLLPLPPDPGRHTLTLPPLPVAVSRANGDIATACTRAHTITIEDPIASTPDAMPKANPPPRPQREEWTSLRRALTYGAIGLAAGALLAYLVRKWMLRPKPAVPPPPPRPAWEIALEKLDEVRHAGLLEVERYEEYFDRVNDAVRAYLGARYGFDGLESTTDEILQALRRASIEQLAMPGVIEFFQECDLVKFANMTPSQPACERALDAAERIVRSTMPTPAQHFPQGGAFGAAAAPKPSAEAGRARGDQP